MADLVDDLLAPLGSVVTPAGLRAGRSAGSVVVHARDGSSELDLVPGGLELVDLPPGATAVAEFRFRDRVRLGARGRHFAIDVAGGLGGLSSTCATCRCACPIAPIAGATCWRPGSRRCGPGPRHDRRAERPRAERSPRRRDGRRGRTARRDLGSSAAAAGRGPVDVTFALAPGDRPLVAAGESVVAGAPIIERVRDPRLTDVVVPAGAEPEPGGRIADGELLFDWRGRWRVAGGEVTEPLDSPIAGIVREVRPGRRSSCGRRARRCAAIVTLGGPTRGRLHVASWVEGELRSGSVDVGLAGNILVVGSRIDAETLTRARAMGVRGIIVAGLASKERRDFLASEDRQRAALHRLPPFAVLVLEGAVRRPLAGPVMDVLEALEGHEVAIVADPPMLIFDQPELDVPTPRPDLVRIRAGQLMGREVDSHSRRARSQPGLSARGQRPVGRDHRAASKADIDRLAEVLKEALA